MWEYAIWIGVYMLCNMLNYLRTFRSSQMFMNCYVSMLYTSRYNLLLTILIILHLTEQFCITTTHLIQTHNKGIVIYVNCMIVNATRQGHTNHIVLPGHIPVPHFRSSMVFPWHVLPWNRGSGSLHNLDLDWIPLPHVTVHVDQPSQFAHRPSTSGTIYTLNKICKFNIRHWFKRQT